MKNIFTLFLLVISANVYSRSLDSSTHYFQKGLEEKTAKRYLLAAGCFEKAIQFNSKFTAAYIENGLVNKEMRRMDASLQNFTKAYELDPGNELVMKELLELYYNYRQFRNAIDMAEKCSSCDNRDRIIGMSYFQMEDYARAEKVLESLLEKDASDAEATYTLARTLLEMGYEAKAISFYEKAIRLDATRSKWFFELGLLYHNNDSYRNAVICFNKAAELGFNRSNDFNENLGFAYLYSGEFDKGEQLLSEIIARKPGDRDLVRDIAQAFYDMKQYDKCLDYCQKLLEADKNDGKALYQAGLCFQKKGQVQRGQQMCDRAIEMDPSLNSLRQKKTTMGL